MKIVQLSVRLNDGGAARVSRDLHQRAMLTRDVDSIFLYGYGKRGKPELNSDNNSICLSNPWRVSMNMVAYKLMNRDVVGPKKLADMISICNWADVVHLHVLHSYYIPINLLIGVLRQSNAKLVWTLHDSWALTGRCAITDNCNEWRLGCGKCATLRNYPPVMFDNSSRMLVRKRAAVRQIVDLGCRIVSPSSHLARNFSVAFPDVEIEVIENGIDLATENALMSEMPAQISRLENGPSSVVRVLIVAHDLSYEGKTDRAFILKLIEKGNIELHTVGKNSPFLGKRVVNHGYISESNQLYKLYASMDVMLFTSDVDNFPLVIGEALCRGLPVIAKDSEAAREVLALVNGRPAFDINEVVAAIGNRSWYKLFYSSISSSDLVVAAQNAYSGKTTFSKYLELYGKI